MALFYYALQLPWSLNFICEKQVDIIISILKKFNTNFSFSKVYVLNALVEILCFTTKKTMTSCFE
jgi:hypothetical protein